MQLCIVKHLKVNIMSDLSNKVALGHYADPREIAAVVAFVASSEAAFITGATINVDGGQNA